MEQKKLLTKRVSILLGLMFIIIALEVFLKAVGDLFLSSLDNFTYTAIIQSLYTVLLGLIVFFATVSIFNIKPRDLLPTKKMPGTDAILSIFIFLGGISLASFITEILLTIAVFMGMPMPEYPDILPAPDNITQIIVYIVIAAVLPAIFEELVCRGAICGTLKGINKGAAIIVSSIVFSLIHMSLYQIPYAFVAGLILAFVYIKYDNIIITMIMHFINNLSSVIMLLYINNLPKDQNGTDMSNLISISYIALTVFIAVISLILYIYKHRCDEKEAQIMKGKEAAKAVCRSAVFWIFIAVFILFTVYFAIQSSISI